MKVRQSGGESGRVRKVAREERKGQNGTGGEDPKERNGKENIRWEVNQKRRDNCR